VARAKRTHRAEARRRYRAASAPDEATESTEDVAPGPGSGRSASPSPTRSTGTPARMGFAAAFREAIHPIHVRPDIASLPWIATRTHALWVPLAITLASTVAIIATNGGEVSLFMFAYFIQTPAIGGVFIAGFLAPRASWLLGVIVGMFSAGCYAVLVLFYPSTIYAGLPPTEAQAREVALSAFILSPIIGGFFAAGAAWYRRFLRLSSPNRGRQGQKPSQKKPGDGRTRGGTSQKASAKR
jgi:hypothetical protein